MKYALALLLAALALAGCTEPLAPRTVAQFMEDEVALYGTLTRCETDPAAANDVECRNARQAADRVAAIEERALIKVRQEAFESARAEYRARLDRERELRIQAEAEARAARLQALTGSTPGPSEEVEGAAPAEAEEPARHDDE